MKAEEIWIFGYGSLTWDKSGIKPIEEKIGELQGWHRDWTWISKRRHGVPTCSLQTGEKVKGIFLKLNPETQVSDLETLRKRERRSTEKVIENASGITGKIYFWTMGSNLEEYNDTKGLKGLELYKALARRACMHARNTESGTMPRNDPHVGGTIKNGVGNGPLSGGKNVGGVILHRLPQPGTWRKNK